MFLQGKKGSEDIVLKAIIVIVVAIIMIVIVTSFGTKILGIFFPNGDKTTMKSFDLLYNVMDLEAESSLGYDLTPVTLYMTKGYCVVLFDSPVKSFKETSVTDTSSYGIANSSTYDLQYAAPDECGKTPKDQCLCLYDGEPSSDLGKKEKNLVELLLHFALAHFYSAHRSNLLHFREDFPGESAATAVVLEQDEGLLPVVHTIVTH